MLHMPRKRAKAQGSFNAEFWTKSADIENEILHQYMVSLEMFSGLEVKTEAAKEIFEKIRAKELQVDTITKHADRLNTRGKKHRSCPSLQPARWAWALCIPGPEKDQRAHFLSSRHGSKHPDHDWIWCPVTSNCGHEQIQERAISSPTCKIWTP
ncbi:hypothetical protein V8E54_009482 [Elaphomyces granulatus]